MQIITNQVSFKKIWNTKEIDLGDIVKVVVDVRLGIVGLDAQMHADIEEKLLEQGSVQEDLWGANLVFNETSYSIEYTSFINIRPGQGNRAMEIQSPELQNQLNEIIKKMIV